MTSAGASVRFNRLQHFLGSLPRRKCDGPEANQRAGSEVADRADEEELARPSREDAEDEGEDDDVHERALFLNVQALLAAITNRRDHRERHGNRHDQHDQCEAPVGITGISLGGYIAFGAVTADRRIRAAVPILGAPEEVDDPAKFPPCAVLAANAGKDIYVPPPATRLFMKNLEQYYSAFPERLKYLEYAESEHFMREEDWNDLWREIIRWFQRFLRL